MVEEESCSTACIVQSEQSSLVISGHTVGGRAEIRTQASSLQPLESWLPAEEFSCFATSAFLVILRHISVMDQIQIKHEPGDYVFIFFLNEEKNS